MNSLTNCQVCLNKIYGERMEQNDIFGYRELEDQFSWHDRFPQEYFCNGKGKILGNITHNTIADTYNAVYNYKLLGTYINKTSARIAVEEANYTSLNQHE